MTLLDEALSLLRELRPHAPIESAWLTDPNARFDEEAWRNSPVATSSKMRDRIDSLLARAEMETFACLGNCGASVPSKDAYCSACFLRERGVQKEARTRPCTHRFTVDGLRNPRPDDKCDGCGETWGAVQAALNR